MKCRKTDFGKFCNKLRIDNNELTCDMAKRLDVSLNYLSSIEHDRRKPPLEWKRKIADLYKLTGEQQKELDKCIDQQRKEFDYLTDFGKFCRELRINNGEFLFDMARKLNISEGYLSMIEHGRYKPFLRWKEEITELYSLTKEQQKELNKCIDKEYDREFDNLTDFSKFCRKFRSNRNESMANMAKRMGISQSYLSKVEHGVVKPPLEWKKIIADEYALTEEQQEELNRCIDSTRTQ